MCPCSLGSGSGSVSVTDGEEDMPASFNQEILLFVAMFQEEILLTTSL